MNISRITTWCRDQCRGILSSILWGLLLVLGLNLCCGADQALPFGPTVAPTPQQNTCSSESTHKKAKRKGQDRWMLSKTSPPAAFANRATFRQNKQECDTIPYRTPPGPTHHFASRGTATIVTARQVESSKGQPICSPCLLPSPWAS